MTSNVEGVKGVLVGVTCRGIALASLGLPPPEGSWGCPASSPRGIIGTLGGPGTGSKHKPGLERLWSSVVSKTVPVWPSVHPDPHRCPHPEGCCGSVGDFLFLTGTLAHLLLTLVLAVAGLGNRALPLAERAGREMGGVGEGGGEEEGKGRKTGKKKTDREDTRVGVRM